MNSKPVALPVNGTDWIRFEVRDGVRRVSCTVSDEALEAASALTLPSTPLTRRRSFDRFRTLIDAAATLKLATLPRTATGPLLLTRDDLRRVPPQTGAPVFGSALRVLPRVAVPNV